MTMPVTAVNKNDGSVFWENEIWCTGKPFIGNSIPVSLREQPLADGKLDLGIAISDTRHHTAARITINYVCHSVIVRTSAAGPFGVSVLYYQHFRLSHGTDQLFRHSTDNIHADRISELFVNLPLGYCINNEFIGKPLQTSTFSRS